MTDDLTAHCLKDLISTFRNYKALGDGALSQVTDRDVATYLGGEDNSVAIIVRHVAGNLRSRFTDFLTSDGEKPNRDRDAEFDLQALVARDEVLAWWDDAWGTTLAALDALSPADLGRTVTIRGESFLVVEALHRLATHTAYHVGQIVFLAKHFAGSRWRSLSIPRGQSARYAQGTFRDGIIPHRESLQILELGTAGSSGYRLITALSERHTQQLHQLYLGEWWTYARTLADTRSVLEHSDFVVGIVGSSDDELKAFARVLTDWTFKALVFDVIVAPHCRTAGLGRQLLEHLVTHPALARVRHLELYCLPDLVPFYEQWGFSTSVSGVTLMRKGAAIHPE